MTHVDVGDARGHHEFSGGFEEDRRIDHRVAAESVGDPESRVAEAFDLGSHLP